MKDFGAIALRRSKVPEAWLIEQLGKLTRHLRRQLAAQEQRQLLLRDLAEQLELFTLGRELAAPAEVAGTNGGSMVEGGEELPGRQSGAEEWKAARGEAGKK